MWVAGVSENTYNFFRGIAQKDNYEEFELGIKLFIENGHVHDFDFIDRQYILENWSEDVVDIKSIYEGLKE